MNSQEFVIWLKGFTEGVHTYNVTPKQWDLMKEKLAEVEDKVLVLETPKFPFGTPNTAPIVPLPHYPNPLDNPYRVTCTPGTSTIGTIGYLSASYISPNTSTANNFPPGTTVTYTTSGGPTWYSINKIENDSTDK
jgi:hypothetical protein